MDILSNLKYAPGSRKKRKRIGRGEGSGHGGTATKGMNGQMSRSGAKHKAWFEGGQMPLQRRIPKFGFTSIFKVYSNVVNVETLEKNATKLNGIVTPISLYKAGIISNLKQPVKILGNGEVKTSFQVEVNAISQSAKEKIESAGGSIKLI
jgi:large subunit ribosomal protein L15